MLKINISETDISLLRHERYTHPHPRVMLKMDVLLYKACGLSNEQICFITGICGNTMRDYWKQYEEGGIERLKEVRFNKPSSKLSDFYDTIKQYFIENPPSSTAMASKKIEELTGIKIGETQTRKILKVIGFKYIKACSVPAKALTEEKKKNKESFWKKT